MQYTYLLFCFLPFAIACHTVRPHRHWTQLVSCRASGSRVLYHRCCCPQSILFALKNEIPAKGEVKGNLDTYKYYDNVSHL
jgi:hypothetical protein